MFKEDMRETNPNLSDEEIFQKARRWVIAELQNIVYKEFLPTILGEKIMEDFQLDLPNDGFTSYDNSINPSISNEFATFAFRFGHTLVPNFFR